MTRKFEHKEIEPFTYKEFFFESQQLIYRKLIQEIRVRSFGRYPVQYLELQLQVEQCDWLILVICPTKSCSKTEYQPSSDFGHFFVFSINTQKENKRG